MKTKTIRAALAAGLFGAASLFALNAYAAAADTTGPKVSSKVIGAPLQEAQKLIQAGDNQGALAKVHEAQALPGRTPDDDYVINEFLASASIGTKDYTTAATAYEAMADSPVLSEDPNKAQTLHNALILATNVKHYQKAIGYGQQLQALGPVDDKVTASLSEAYYYTNDFAHAQEMAQKSVDAAKAAGKMPDRGAMQIILNSEAGQKNEAAAETTLEQLAVGYGDPQDWGQIIDIALGTKGMRDIDALYLNRLRFASGGNAKEDDYTLAAGIATQLYFPGEARAILTEGMGKGIVRSGKAQAMLAQARSKAAADEKSIPSQEAAAEKQGGEYNVKLAQAEYGYGRYAQAEAAARRAMAKGGMKDASEAQMVLGQALVGQGKYADAITAFQAVSGGAAVTKAAHLWADWATYKSKSAAASATSGTTQ
jgi:tetratricopeptide (TPR) repeat protein